MSPDAGRRSHTPLWLLYVFLGLVVLFAATIIILVREGSSIGLAITVPAAVIAAACTGVLFLRNLFVGPLNEPSPRRMSPASLSQPVSQAFAPPRELPDAAEVTEHEPEASRAAN